MRDRVTPEYARNGPDLTEELRLPRESHRAAKSGELEGAVHVNGQQPNPDRNWIHQLLGRGLDKPYPQEPSNLTARPFYRPRHISTQPGDLDSAGFVPLREGNVPTNNAGSLQASESDKSRPTIGEGADKQLTPESFSTVILDLETLLDKALSVAEHGTDREYTEALPAILEEASRMLTNEAHGLDKDRSEGSSSTDSEDSIYHSGTTLALPSRSKDRVVIIEPDDEDLHSGHFRQVRNATPYPSSPAPASRQPSMPPGYEPSQAIPLQALSSDLTRSTTQEQLPALGQDSSLGKSPHFELLQKPHDQEVGTAPSSGRPSMRSPSPPTASEQTDWAYIQSQSQPGDTLQVPQARAHRVPTFINVPSKAEVGLDIIEDRPLENFPSSGEIQKYIALHNQPPIQPRMSSVGLRARAFPGIKGAASTSAPTWHFEGQDGDNLFSDCSQGARLGNASLYRQSSQSGAHGQSGQPRMVTISPRPTHPVQRQETSLGLEMTTRQPGRYRRYRRRHSSSEQPGFRVGRSHRHAPVARDWETRRKRWVAAVACISTALLGLIVGIYAGEVPAIQYTLADEHHYTILGNVFLYIGVAIPTVLLWPLPLLHGRKPYTLIALGLLLPLQFPQAIVLNAPRSPSTAGYRVGLLLSRALSGVALGFANINFKATLLDLFGASLQSSNPHQEVVNEDDVRRHGGGMGVWLGIWAWCFMGSIGVGFLIGAVVISALAVDWGFYITINLIAFVLFLNVLTPEVRRAAHRRSVTPVRSATEMARGFVRGEVMLHITSRGPTWWWEEVFAGLRLCARMLRQPGFIVLSLYTGWIYGQIVMLNVVSAGQIYFASYD